MRNYIKPDIHAYQIQTNHCIAISLNGNTDDFWDEQQLEELVTTEEQKW